MINHTDIYRLQTCTEYQVFDRKSVRIDAKALAITLIAFANADGGELALGIEDDGKITGVDGQERHINELLRANLDFCVPSVNMDAQFLECVDYQGKPNHIILLKVYQSRQLHANQADEVFYRVGDKSKKLNFEQRVQLMYAKGSIFFEDTPVADATLNDIDIDYLQHYLDRIGYTRSPEAFLRGSGKFLFRRGNEDCISAAAILLFGKDPQRFFPRAQIRFVRFEGEEERFGKQINIIKDITFRGRILEVTQDAIAFMRTQLKERSMMDDNGIFRTIPEYPETCWMELIVNAVAHRDYSIKGTGIDIKLFDHSVSVESPGILPGLVRAYNIREIHCSRNPKIMMFLHEYGLVKDLGEGVNRMFVDMEAAKLPAPQYRQVEFILKVEIRNPWENGAILTKGTDDITTTLTEVGETIDPSPVQMNQVAVQMNQVAVQMNQVADQMNQVRQFELTYAKVYTEVFDKAIADHYQKPSVRLHVRNQCWAILKTIYFNQDVSRETIGKELQIKPTSLQRLLRRMRVAEMITFEGKTSNGHWKITLTPEKQ